MSLIPPPLSRSSTYKSSQSATSNSDSDTLAEKERILTSTQSRTRGIHGYPSDNEKPNHRHSTQSTHNRGVRRPHSEYHPNGLPTQREKSPASSSQSDAQHRQSSDSNTLYPASSFGRRSLAKSFTSLVSGVSSDDELGFNGRFSRADLSQSLGEECIVHTTEIDSVPCAGVRIRQGRLRGLIAWRFVVQLHKTSPADRIHVINVLPRIIGNFILDTGARNCSIAPEILAALEFKGNMQPGQPVTLVIQGVEIQCVVGEYGEASVLSLDFMIAGGLALYFDTTLGAPVIYVESGKQAPENIPRTVSRRHTIQQKVKSFIDTLRPRSNSP